MCRDFVDPGIRLANDRQHRDCYDDAWVSPVSASGSQFNRRQHVWAVIHWFVGPSHAARRGESRGEPRSGFPSTADLRIRVSPPAGPDPLQSLAPRDSGQSAKCLPSTIVVQRCKTAFRSGRRAARPFRLVPSRLLSRRIRRRISRTGLCERDGDLSHRYPRSMYGLIVFPGHANALA
jgi:hypothetical protein